MKKKVINGLPELSAIQYDNQKDEFGNKVIVVFGEDKEIVGKLTLSKGGVLVVTESTAWKQPQPYSNSVKAEIARLDRDIDGLREHLDKEFGAVWDKLNEIIRAVND